MPMQVSYIYVPDFVPVESKAGMLKTARTAGSRTDPDADIAFRLSEDLPLKEVGKIWKTLSETRVDRKHDEEWYLNNPEMLIDKSSAFHFLESRVFELLKWRNYTSEQIKSLETLLKAVEDEIKDNESTPPPMPVDYEAYQLDWPDLFVDPYQIVDGDWKQLAASIRLRQDERTKCVKDKTQSKYLQPKEAWRREQAAVQAVKKFNKEYLEIKIASLTALRDRLQAGIGQVVSMFTDRSKMGAGRVDYGTLFHDIHCVPEYCSATDKATNDEEKLVFNSEDEEEAYTGTEDEEDPFFERE